MKSQQRRGGGGPDGRRRRKRRSGQPYGWLTRTRTSRSLAIRITATQDAPQAPYEAPRARRGGPHSWRFTATMKIAPRFLAFGPIACSYAESSRSGFNSPRHASSQRRKYPA